MLIAIEPGRSLCWAPRWECSDSAVLFDACSGDYWVLAPDGRAVLEWLQLEPSIPRDALLARLAALTLDGAALLVDLARAGLLVGVVNGQSVRLAQAVDADD